MGQLDATRTAPPRDLHVARVVQVLLQERGDERRRLEPVLRARGDHVVQVNLFPHRACLIWLKREVDCERVS